MTKNESYPMSKIDSIHTLISELQTPIDRESIPQNQLDLVKRGRKSLFPWRGQFSPELIELLLTHYANPKAVVVDPFVGCGTTLFEALRKSLTCFGIEINPAAVEIARTVHFVNIDIPKRVEYIRMAKAIIEKYLPSYYNLDFFLFDKNMDRVNARSRKESFSTIW